ncbi:MAG: TonB family protein [Thermoanaerobaculia bacterium]
MLEQSVALSSSRAHARTAILPLSVALHILVIAAVVGGSVWNVGTPTDPPPQTVSYILNVSPPLPPAAPAPQRRAEAPEPVQPQPDVAPAVVPDVIPDIVPEVPAQTAGPEEGTAEGTANGDPLGTDAGVPGGIPGSLTVVPPPAPRTYRIGEGVTAPALVTRVEPRYPELARKIGKEGTVVLECTIDSRGWVRDARVVRSAHPLLDDAAREAVLQWRFRPGTLGGKPVDVLFHLTVNFDLGR